MTNNTIKFLTKKEDLGKRLDVILSEKMLDLTRSNLKKIIETKNVSINDKVVVLPSKKIKLNDSITINIEIKEKLNLIPYKTKLDCIPFETSTFNYYKQTSRNGCSSWCW